MPPRAPDESDSSELKLPDPVAAAGRQLDRDKDRAGWKPELLQHKHDRMKASPFAYLRGASPLFYELLAACPQLAAGADGEGWIVGDLHLENFGAFRVEPLGEEPEVVFDLNDFDDTVIAPWRWDMLRLVTSLLLASRENGIDGPGAVELGRTALAGYAEAMDSGKTPKPPASIAKLVDQVSDRKRVQFLDQRTHESGGRRKLVRGDRYMDLPASVLKDVPHAIRTFRRADGTENPPEPFLDVIDAAFRVAGTGSLGCRRVAVLVEGKGSPDGNAIFDLKEAWSPAPEVLGIKSDLDPNVRVVTGIRACLAHPPFALGTTTLWGRPMIGRRLMPQEDKLDASKLDRDEFSSVAAYFGRLVALAHRRGATKPAARPWSEAEREKMLGRAVAVAGWHEAVYLAFCQALPGK
jgi:uncharacterized protein (DUF2252 family)